MILTIVRRVADAQIIKEQITRYKNMTGDRSESKTLQNLKK